MQTKDLEIGMIVGVESRGGGGAASATRAMVLDNRRWSRRLRFEAFSLGGGKNSGIPLAMESVERRLIDDEIVTLSASWVHRLTNPSRILGPWDEVQAQAAIQKQVQADYHSKQSADREAFKIAHSEDEVAAGDHDVNLRLIPGHASGTAPANYSISRADLHKLLAAAGGAS